ncbi:PQQ-binding-like beta-propeller repeat protein [Streptomyces niveus]|uniref:protein kinase domain-containing protein n=1 Tax=Streptomyces niveus TaxID=193462 RepID=UPI0036D35BDE
MLGELHERSPRQVGPYRILARLGAGGMGEVYLGADTRPTTSGAASLAAVKVVRADLLASGEHAFRDRFRREISTARAVEGGFTARLLTGDADAPAPWLATEYVAGPTLDRAVRECGPLPVETVRSLGLGLVRALRGIHHARVLHRDLKPANVLLGADGPRVIDFGIARDFGASTLTATGAMVGSPGYMSPEHVLGGRHVVSASDVFSLASVLCYAATGEGLFGTGPVAAVLYRVSQAEARLDEVPDELRALIEDCLRPDPSARPDAIELEARFRDTGAPDPVVWPEAVRAQVALYEGELARTVQAVGAVAGRVPTMPGASPVHSARTVTGPPRQPPPRQPDARRRRTTILAVVAGALTLGVLGAFGIRALQDDPAPKSPGPEAGSEKNPQAALIGLDKHGADRSRHFPVDPAARPDGWKPWTAKLSGRPWDCALNSEILVCRMFYGGLEAVGAADGKPRWKAPSAEPDAEPLLGASSGMYIPGDATNPVIHGDSVLSTEGGMVRSRSLKDGTVRWKRPLKGEGTVRLANVGEAMAGGGVAFFTTRGEGTEVHAFDAETGKPLWKRALSTYVGAEVGYGGFGPDAFAGGRLLASTDGGLTGFDARTGKPTPYTVPGEDGGDCVSVRARGGEVLCGIEGGGSVALDAETLLPIDTGQPGFDSDLPPQDLVTVGSRTYLLAPDSGSTRMELVDTYEGADSTPRTVGTFPPAPKDGRYLYSEASVVGDTAVFLDNEFLYTLPVAGDAPQGTRSRIEGAPGNRADSGLGDDIDGQVWEPELISVGGVVFLVFHDGTVRSTELPG